MYLGIRKYSVKNVIQFMSEPGTFDNQFFQLNQCKQKLASI